MSLLETLIVVSEKAANIARICRQDEHLFKLLIQEKGDSEANPRFVQDFKTLADVLIQETLKHDIGIRFPEMKNKIFGEENNIFKNTLGEEISVEILNTITETGELIARVLNGDNHAAELLAIEIFKDISLTEVNTTQPLQDTAIDTSNVGIWIDPIDSTAEYIHGKEKTSFASGLKCVTVLIGVYDLITGCPLLGVINQPFQKFQNKWRGHCYWGISNEIKVGTSLQSNSDVVYISGSESTNITDRLKKAGFLLVEAAGAGFKFLVTIVGAADAYILSKDSTFKWDTCGPHAILKSLGGDVVVYEDALNGDLVSIKYKVDGNEGKLERSCNRGGIIGYRDQAVLERIIAALRY